MPRKRFNAFDEFSGPAAEGSSPEPDKTLPAETSANQRTAEPEERGAYNLFGDPRAAQNPAQQVERIERLTPSQMIPDRFQPRRLLPSSLRSPFFHGQIDCYNAARQWLQLAKNDAGIQEEINRLLAMGSSIVEHGQIKPITGSWVDWQGGGYRFQIETGERRFWAACLQSVLHTSSDEPQLRVEVITHPTRVRQVIENRHAEPPSAVGQACEIAALILSELGSPPSSDEEDEYNYFRKALDQQRMPNGFWEKLTGIMQLTRPRLIQFRDILDFPSPLLDLADRHRIPERVLREIRSAPKEQWRALMRDAVENKRTSDDIAEILQKPRPPSKSEARNNTPPEPSQQAINALKRFADAMNRVDEDTQNAILDELANDLVLNGQAEAMLLHLRDLSERLRIRQQNRARRRQV